MQEFRQDVIGDVAGSEGGKRARHQDPRPAVSGPVVIGSGVSVSVMDLIELTQKALGTTLEVRHIPAKAGEMPAVVVDPGRAHAAGWSPRFPQLADGLVGVWEEWSKADVKAPVAAGGL